MSTKSLKIDLLVNPAEVGTASKQAIDQLRLVEKQAGITGKAINDALGGGTRGRSNGAAGVAAKTTKDLERELARQTANAEREARRQTAAAEREARRQELVHLAGLNATARAQSKIHADQIREEQKKAAAIEKIQNDFLLKLEKKQWAAYKAKMLKPPDPTLFQTAAGKIIGSLGGIAAGYLSLRTAGAIWNEINAGIERNYQAQKAATDEFNRYVEAQREYQSMIGGTATTASTLKEVEYQLATGLRPDEADAFSKSMMGRGAQFMDRLPTSTEGNEFEQYRQLAGGLAAMKGIDPQVMGNLAGSTMGFKDWSKDAAGKLDPEHAAERATEQLNQMFRILDRGAGDGKTLAEQLTKAAGTMLSDSEMGGLFKNGNELATAISLAAEINPAESEMFARSGALAVRQFDDERAGPLLKRAGITQEDSYFSALSKLAPVVTAEAAAGPKGTTIQDVLGKYFEDIRAKQALAGGINSGIGKGVIADRLREAEKAAGLNVVKTQFATDAADPRSALGQRMIEAQGIAAQQVKGVKGRGLLQLEAKGQAFLENTGLDRETWKDSVNNIVNPYYWGIYKNPVEHRKYGAMYGILSQSAQKAGVPWDDTNWGVSQESDRGIMQKMMTKMEAAGFDPFTGDKMTPAAATSRKEELDALMKINGNLEKLVGGPMVRFGATGIAPPPPPPRGEPRAF